MGVWFFFFKICVTLLFEKGKLIGQTICFIKKLRLFQGNITHLCSILMANFDEDFIIIETVSYGVGWANLKLTEGPLPLPSTCQD